MNLRHELANVFRQVDTLFRNQQKGPKQIRQVVSIIGLLLIFLVLGYQVYKNWNEIKTYNWRIDPLFIFYGFGLYSINLLATASTWSLIIGKVGQFPNTITNLRYYSLTNLAMRLPTPLPYIGARVEAYSAKGVSRLATLAAMGIELTVSVLAAGFLLILLLPFETYDIIHKINNLGWILLLVPFVVFIVRPNWLFFLLNKAFVFFHKAPIQADVTWKNMLTWTVSYLFLWMNAGLWYLFIANSIYPVEPKNLAFFIFAVALSGIIGWLSQILFFIPNLALRQIALAYLLSFVLPWSVAVAIVLIIRGFGIVFELAWAAFFAFGVPQAFPKNTTKD